MAPFQVISHSRNGTAAQFTDQHDSTRTPKSCLLWNALVKLPYNVTEMKLRWLNASYFEFSFLNKTLHFKVGMYTIKFILYFFVD